MTLIKIFYQCGVLLSFIACFQCLSLANSLEQNNRFRVSGIYSLNSQFKFSILDLKTSKSHWLAIGQSKNKFKITDYDLTTNSLVIELENSKYSLPVGLFSFVGERDIRSNIEASIRASKKSAQTTPSNPADHESPLNSSAYEDYRSNTLEHRNNKLIVSENSYNSFGSLKKAMHIDSASDSVFEQSNEISANIPKTWTPARTLSRVNKVHNPDKMAEIGAHASSVTR